MGKSTYKEFILQSNIFLYLRLKTPLISKNILAIENTENKKYISICSLWEMSIKLGLRKLEFDGTISEIIDLIKENDFEILPLSLVHIVEYQGLPFVHRDPFDRVLIVQSMVENLTILTRDENIPLYNIKTSW